MAGYQEVVSKVDRTRRDVRIIFIKIQQRKPTEELTIIALKLEEKENGIIFLLIEGTQQIDPKITNQKLACKCIIQKQKDNYQKH